MYFMKLQVAIWPVNDPQNTFCIWLSSPFKFINVDSMNRPKHLFWGACAVFVRSLIFLQGHCIFSVFILFFRIVIQH